MPRQHAFGWLTLPRFSAREVPLNQLVHTLIYTDFDYCELNLVVLARKDIIADQQHRRLAAKGAETVFFFTVALALLV